MKRSFIIPVNLCDIYLKLSHLLLVLSIIMGVSPVFAGDQSTHNKLPGSIAEAKTDTPAIRKNIPVEKSSVRIYVLQGEAQRPERVDSTSSAPHFQDPNLIPYRSHKSFYKHILAFPSTVWNAIWYPLGQGFIWMEQQHLHQKLVAIFTRKRVSGITPIATIGGNTAFAFGLMAYHHNLFGNKEDARLAYMYTNSRNNRATFHYMDVFHIGGLSNPVSFALNSQYLKDSDENFFPGGNGGKRGERTTHSTRRVDAEIRLVHTVSKAVTVETTMRYDYVEIGEGDNDDFPPISPSTPGFGFANIGSAGAILNLNFRKGFPRVISGFLWRFIYEYNSEFSNVRYRYHRYLVELSSFIPVPSLPPDRRFAVRVRLEKTDPVNNAEIPFYELPLIGNSRTLRGFDRMRFRDRGALLFNFEYRYPIFDTWDAVLFLDEGQVFHDYKQLALEQFHWSAGFGVRIMTRSDYFFRLELAFSNERTKLIFRLSPNF